MSVTAAELVGREEELTELASFLDGELPSALVLEGEAGIRKTTIWREGIRPAEQRDLAQPTRHFPGGVATAKMLTSASA